MTDPDRPRRRPRLELSFEEAADGYKAMDDRRATKVLFTLWPGP